MTPLLVARIALLLAGIGLFVVGMRTRQEIFRYVAIALLAVAVALRFVERARAKRDG